jgi:hypothetical protein
VLLHELGHKIISRSGFPVEWDQYVHPWRELVVERGTGPLPLAESSKDKARIYLDNSDPTAPRYVVHFIVPGKQSIDLQQIYPYESLMVSTIPGVIQWPFPSWLVRSSREMHYTYVDLKWGQDDKDHDAIDVHYELTTPYPQNPNLIDGLVNQRLRVWAHECRAMQAVWGIDDPAVNQFLEVRPENRTRFNIQRKTGL